MNATRTYPDTKASINGIYQSYYRKEQAFCDIQAPKDVPPPREDYQATIFVSQGVVSYVI